MNAAQQSPDRILSRRRAALYAALAALMVKRDPSMPELDLVHRWLDDWRGVGLIVDGMLRQGFAIDMSASDGPGWSVVILKDRPSGGAPEIIASAHAATPWRAVQIASWNALDGKPMPGGRTGTTSAAPDVGVA